jgi:hypothetical protein
MFIGGRLAMTWLLLGRLVIGGVGFDIHTLLYAAVAVIVGVQSVQFWIFAKIYGMREGLVPPDPWFSSLIARVARLEYGADRRRRPAARGPGARHLCGRNLGRRGIRRLEPGADDAHRHPLGPGDRPRFQTAYGAFSSASSTSAPRARPQPRPPAPLEFSLANILQEVVKTFGSIPGVNIKTIDEPRSGRR